MQLTSQLPVPFIARLVQIIPPEKFQAVSNTFLCPHLTTFRVNTLKTSINSLLNELKTMEITPCAVNGYELAFSISHEQRELLTKSDAFLQGRLYIQNLSSMLVPIILDPQPNENILDLAAAPGSKTSQIAALMQNKGRIAAVEKSKTRFFKLKNNLQTQGVTGVQFYLKDGATVWRHCENMFDRVLLDAPCSSEARFSLDDPKTFQFWSEKKIAEMARVQWQLLYSAFRSLKVGGVLVYSTCSFAPEENEAQISKLIQKFPEQVRVESIFLNRDNLQPGLIRWQKTNFSTECQKCIRILPNELMSGFFICKIRKIK